LKMEPIVGFPKRRDLELRPPGKLPQKKTYYIKKKAKN